MGNKPKKFDFVHQTVSRREARGHGTRLHPPNHVCLHLWTVELVPDCLLLVHSHGAQGGQQSRGYVSGGVAVRCVWQPWSLCLHTGQEGRGP